MSFRETATNIIKNTIRDKRYAPLSNRLVEAIDPNQIVEEFDMLPKDFIERNGITSIDGYKLWQMTFKPNELGFDKLVNLSPDNIKINGYITYMQKRYSSSEELRKDLISREKLDQSD